MRQTTDNLFHRLAGQRTAISLALVFALAMAFVFTAFAAPDIAPASGGILAAASQPKAQPEQNGANSGSLTGTGTLLVNGNVVQSGATVMSGSLVAAGLDGDAMLDLGAVGRLKLRPGTEVKVDFSSDRLTLELRRCGSFTLSSNVASAVSVVNQQLMQVASTTGDVKVRGQIVVSDDGNAPPPNATAPGNLEDLTLKAGESRAFDKIETISADKDTIYTVNCVEDQAQTQPAGGGSKRVLPYTLLAIAGVTTGVILGVTNSSESRPRPSVTPIQ